MQAVFQTSAKEAKGLPVEQEPEVAFIGRSNSGKSTLINAITQHKSLARTSNTPGRTQMANFFLFNNSWRLVDLPGFGYSETGGGVRASWQGLVEAYVKRKALQKLVYVTDLRRSLGDDDFEVLSWLGEQTLVVIAFTKIDKLSKSEQNKAKQARLRELETRSLEVAAYLVSGTKKTGVDNLRDVLFC